MKWTPSPRLKKIIKDAAEDYLRELHLTTNELTIKYLDENKDSKFGGSGSVCMEVVHEATYLRSSMDVYPCAETELKENGAESIRQIVAHEISHIAVWPLFALSTRPYKTEAEVDEANEQLTELLSRFVYASAKQKKK